MKRFMVFCLLFLGLCGCVDKHPYKYVINNNIKNPNKETSNWQVQEVKNGTDLPMPPEKKDNLTKEIIEYLKMRGFSVSKVGQDTLYNETNSFLIKPKIIQTMAQISHNEAGWHGATEDPLNFWSHFSPGTVIERVEGSVPALSLYVEIYSAGQKYYENAGGIELEGKYNKYSFRMTLKDELVSDNDRFINAMDIAFKPLLEAVK